MKIIKSELRTEYKAVRQEAKSSVKDKKICGDVLESSLFQNADTVFVYHSSGTEVDTSEIIGYALKKGMNIALPKCTDRDGSMEFYIISDMESQLSEGMYEIMEPVSEKCVRASDSENSLCIVPGLAFDKMGHRLGYGKGYYDRFLSGFKGKSIGLCYSACLCSELPSDRYDYKVDAIITENEIINLR